MHLSYLLEITYFGDPEARAAAGEFLNVPLLAGDNENENDVFILAAEIVAGQNVIPVLTEIISDINNVVSFYVATLATLIYFRLTRVQ